MPKLLKKVYKMSRNSCRKTKHKNGHEMMNEGEETNKRLNTAKKIKIIQVNQMNMHSLCHYTYSKKKKVKFTNYN